MARKNQSRNQRRSSRREVRRSSANREIRMGRIGTRNSQRQLIRDSVLTMEEFYLNKHDEEKVLLFLTGLVFGMGLVATILDEFLYGGLAMVVVGLVLLLIELNVEERMYKL